MHISSLWCIDEPSGRITASLEAALCSPAMPWTTLSSGTSMFKPSQTGRLFGWPQEGLASTGNKLCQANPAPPLVLEFVWSTWHIKIKGGLGGKKKSKHPGSCGNLGCPQTRVDEHCFWFVLIRDIWWLFVLPNDVSFSLFLHPTATVTRCNTVVFCGLL